MSALFSFSFKSKWDFDVIQDYLADKSDASVRHSVPKSRPGVRDYGINREVDFSPRYHQVSLNKATDAIKLSEHDHDNLNPRQLLNRSYTVCLKSNDIYKQRLYEIKRRRLPEEPIKDFKVSMHCSCKDDDRVKLAQDWLSRVDHPYKNPKPHDFRPVCLHHQIYHVVTLLLFSNTQGNIIMLEKKPKMRFVSTPGPGRRHLSSRRSGYSHTLSGTYMMHWYCYQSCNHIATPARSVSEAGTFITKSTPSAKYSKDLYFNKGVQLFILFCMLSLWSPCSITPQRSAPTMRTWIVF